MEGRQSAQARADRIAAFREELAQLESELGAVLDAAQRARISSHHDALLAEYARAFDVATTEPGRQLALGLRLASFLGALALCIAVVLFVERFWGNLATGTQVGLLVAGTLAALGLTEFAARWEKTLYFAGLAALVAFAAFVTDISLLGQIYNLVPSPHAFFFWALFAGALAYGYGFRLLLVAAIITGAIWVGGTLAGVGGGFWTNLFDQGEYLLLPAAGSVVLGLLPHGGKREGFCPIYRTIGLVIVFWVVLWRAAVGEQSLLPLSPAQAEAVYQVVGFLVAGLAIWGGIKWQWSEVTYTGVTAFTILLYIKAADWWWDWMPRWLFFLVLGGIAIGVMLVLKRLKERLGGEA